MRRALVGRGIVLGPSLWALTGRDPLPLDELIPAVQHRPRARTAASRRAPVEGQLALF
jgi:DNA polymerase-1